MSDEQIITVHRFLNPLDNAVTLTRTPLWVCASRLLRDDEEWVITNANECRHFDCDGPHRWLTVGPPIVSDAGARGASDDE